LAQSFETIRVVDASPAQLEGGLRNLRGVPVGLKLDTKRGQLLASGERRWAFVLTQEAVERWERLGAEPITLAVLVYQLPGQAQGHVQRLLLALPGEGDTVNLEMRDTQWQLLWTGTGTLKNRALDFAMPIRRERVDAEGLMAGRIDADGRLTLRDARLPRPTAKQTPDHAPE
jgi:hypothetical protein